MQRDEIASRLSALSLATSCLEAARGVTLAAAEVSVEKFVDRALRDCHAMHPSFSAFRDASPDETTSMPGIVAAFGAHLKAQSTQASTRSAYDDAERLRAGDTEIVCL